MLSVVFLFCKMTFLYVSVHVVRHTSVVFKGHCYWTFTLFIFIMAGRLLLVVLMYSFSEMRAQALLPPKLTVNPPMITETDSVTLNCQTPSSVSVSRCYFHIVKGEPAKMFSCLKTLTGTELLKMSHQSSPAEVKVTCFYLHVSQSPESDVSSIIIRTSLPPKLTVNPPVINETNSVTLNCQTPSSVSVSQCYFLTLSGGNMKDSSCLKTLTGTELLKMSHQSSPAEVEVMCFYTVKLGETASPSPHSDTSSITIHSQTPQMSLQHFHGDNVLFTCSLPGSAHHDTRCNLYFGEASDPVLTTTIWKGRSSTTKQWFCQFTVTIDDLLSRLRLVQQSDASCDYSLGSEPNSLSPRSDGYSLTAIVEKESRKTQTMLTSTMTTGLTISRPGVSTPLTPVKLTSGWTVGTPSNTVFISSVLTSVKPASETDSSMTLVNPASGDETIGSSVSTPVTKDRSYPETPLKTALAVRIWKFVAVVAGCGATVGVILLVSAIHRNQKSAASEEVKRQGPQNENYDIYHMYSTISEEPATSTPKDMAYSTVQLH